MKKAHRNFWAVLLLSLLPFGLTAKDWSLSDWLKDLDKRIRTTERRRSQKVAAAAVRGAKQPDTEKLYWKDKNKDLAVNPAELEEFKAAVKAAQSGKGEEATGALDAFLKKHPDSPLAPDAKQTLALLKPAPAPAAASAEKTQ